MQWLDSITVPDGIEEKDTERIVSHIYGDDRIQLSGWFKYFELHQLAEYLKAQPLPQVSEPRQQYHQQI